jgi:hypothetical protein
MLAAVAAQLTVYLLQQVQVVMAAVELAVTQQQQVVHKLHQQPVQPILAAAVAAAAQPAAMVM